MPLETATYISDLNVTNPAATDGLSQADDHMRLIKATLKATFPGVTAAVTPTHAAINAVAALDPSGAVRQAPVGSVVSFPKAPSSLGVGGVTTSGPFAYLECDGTTTWLIADYPDLAAFLGTLYGGNGTTTFGVPNYKDTGRFLRSRTASVAVGTYQSSQNKSHTHTQQGSFTSTTESATHTHGPGSLAGTTSSANSSLDHTHNFTAAGSSGGSVGGGTSSLTTGVFTTAGANSTLDHTHNFAVSGGATAGQSANHTHNTTISGATSTGSADGAEARPEAGVVVMAIKT